MTAEEWGSLTLLLILLCAAAVILGGTGAPKVVP
jgi:hypothetical protein